MVGLQVAEGGGAIRAPFTPEQVIALNRWQGRSDVPSFTCPADGTHGSERHSDRRILVATTERWECERCAYVQHWAYSFMVDGDSLRRAMTVAQFNDLVEFIGRRKPLATAREAAELCRQWMAANGYRIARGGAVVAQRSRTFAEWDAEVVPRERRRLTDHLITMHGRTRDEAERIAAEAWPFRSPIPFGPVAVKREST